MAGQKGLLSQVICLPEEAQRQHCLGEYFFIPCLANPPTSKIGDLLEFLFHPPLHHLYCKYGAPKQAKHEQINVFWPVSENFLFQNKFLFCPPLKYFRHK
jgi:hypothetical protein